jgi:predicted phage terminase large subunit-like protein
MKNKGSYNFYITTDLATSTKQNADFKVISVWAYNNNGDWFWVDGVCYREDINKFWDDLFRLAQEYRPQSVGIEVSGQQGGYINWIQSQMIERNIWFTLASEGNENKPGIRPNTNKLVRFNSVVPLFKLGKIYFPLEMKSSPPVAEAMNELSLVSNAGFKSKHDDFADTISMLSVLKPWKPSEESPVKPGNEEGIWEFATPDGPGSRMSSYIV